MLYNKRKYDKVIEILENNNCTYEPSTTRKNLCVRNPEKTLIQKIKEAGYFITYVNKTNTYIVSV